MAKIKVKITKELDERKKKRNKGGRCQKGYKTHPKRKTKKMFGRKYRNCVKAEGKMSKSYCEETPCDDMGFSQRASCAKHKKCPSPKKNEEIEEVVYSDKQRRYMCALSKQGAKRPKGLTKKEAGKKCKGPMKEADPKKGTGKKPKGSGRRLYTDENPNDTVSVSFKSVSAIKKTLSKPSFKSKSHKRQSQIINLIHQRSRAAYKNAKDPKVKARLKKAFDYAKQRKEASKKKTIRMRKNKK